MTNTARVIAVANQKGGVAKTTTAINLAASLALANQRILLVDLDPQANLTSGLGLKGQHAPAGTIYDALMAQEQEKKPDPRAFVIQTSVDNLSIVPADRQLTGAEIELVAEDHRERRLRNLTETLRADFDYVFIDSPPSLGLLTLNALVAADTVLIPLNCEYYALEGIADLMATIDGVRAALNSKLDVEGVLLTMADERTNLGQQVAANVREFFGDKVFRTVIPRNIRLGEAPSHGLPVILYDPRSRGAEAYVALAREFLGSARDAPWSASAQGADSAPAHLEAERADAGTEGATAASEAGGRSEPAPPSEPAGDKPGRQPGEQREGSTEGPADNPPVPQADGDSG